MRTVEQERAANALSRIEELSSKTNGFKKRYRAYLDRLGPTIVMNGLGQALASERAAAGPTPKKEDVGQDPAVRRRRRGAAVGPTPKKKEDEEAHHELCISLHQWLCREETGVYPSAADIIEALMEHDESLYLRAQAEALAWIEWHKKFCRASFPKSEGE